MILGRVTATVVSTRKNEHLTGYKLMSVTPIRPDGSINGKPILAIDATDSGKGDIVLGVKEGGSLQLITGSREIPENAVIAAVVDDMILDDGESHV